MSRIVGREIDFVRKKFLSGGLGETDGPKEVLTNRWRRYAAIASLGDRSHRSVIVGGRTELR